MTIQPNAALDSVLVQVWKHRSVVVVFFFVASMFFPQNTSIPQLWLLLFVCLFVFLTVPFALNGASIPSPGLYHLMCEPSQSPTLFLQDVSCKAEGENQFNSTSAHGQRQRLIGPLSEEQTEIKSRGDKRQSLITTVN